MILNMNINIQITGGAALGSRISLAVQTNPFSRSNPCRDGNLQLLTLFNNTLSMTVAAGTFYNSPFTVTGGTGRGDGKETGASSNLAGTSAGRTGAGSRSLCSTRTMTDITGLLPVVFHLYLITEYGIFEFNFHIITEITASGRTTSSAGRTSAHTSAATEKGVEYAGKISAEDIFKPGKGRSIEARTTHIIHTCKTILVVGLFFLSI
jgi:hypothetical protein